jgi:hypothetical protein
MLIIGDAMSYDFIERMYFINTSKINTKKDVASLLKKISNKLNKVKQLHKIGFYSEAYIDYNGKVTFAYGIGEDFKDYSDTDKNNLNKA